MGLLTAANIILARELGQEMRLLGVRLSQLKFADEEGSCSGKTVKDYFKQAKRLKLDLEEGEEEEGSESSREPTSESVFTFCWFCDSLHIKYFTSRSTFFF